MRAPPVARLATAFAAGVGWGLSGAPLWLAPLPGLVWLAAPRSPSEGPLRPLCIAVALIGAVVGAPTAAHDRCEALRAGRARIEVRFLAAPRAGSAPFDPGDGCGAATVVVSDSLLAAGAPLLLEGTWVPGRVRPWFRAGEATPVESGSALEDFRWAPVRWRDGLVRRLDGLYGERAPLVAALTLARREGMDRELADTFARTGIAHLLAISGFHVGIIAALALALLRVAGVERRRAGVGAAALSWAYVGLIGFPDAACRAALILAVVAAGRARGRPPARWGALATALLILLLLEPSRLSSPGFQLSFAGAGGLVAWAGFFTEAVRRATHLRCPRALASALGAGVAATLATLPVVAWHFERVSVVGIPVTLAATPLVSLALPGAIATLALDFVWHGAAVFLAGGVDVLLAALERGTGAVARLSWASVWVGRPIVVAGVLGCVIGTALSRHPRVGARGRRALVGAYVAVATLGVPVAGAFRSWGSVEVVVIDVGQGDAVAVRSPRGRWLLVDAGPPGRGPGDDPGAHPAVRALRARGAGRLEALVLTHPDLDHIGGAAAVLRSLEVRGVLDPAVPAGRGEYLTVLQTAAAEAVPWRAARAGAAFHLDGMAVSVLAPDRAEWASGETNEASVVLLISYGAFDVLLTGDAYKATERRLLGGLPDLEVLKLGHHGSDTSTDSLLLATGRPDVAVVSVGRGNRYGHPTPAVLARLERAGVPLYRTDRLGTITVTGRRDGSFEVRPRVGAGRGGRAGTGPQADRR